MGNLPPQSVVVNLVLRPLEARSQASRPLILAMLQYLGCGSGLSLCLRRVAAAAQVAAAGNRLRGLTTAAAQRRNYPNGRLIKTVFATMATGGSDGPQRLSDPKPKQRTNRLIHEKSPYLLQHAHNPVDWYPWGEEAFAKAKKEDKPIFLSV
ncbi:hypothetical protein scyTo_0017516 [Scyliorhinus torazame]|uniref:Spermatogenesis-associated protein 20-like TRX domain-containing protein n=1 Tax=Scyliorhinus torazame TaxID=75743 RepID=A0A401PUU6_SCYTO|nr:hypothetical protein [Scyliorhinus torazame]